MIFVCPDCNKQVDISREMRRCGPVGHEPCVPVDDGTGNRIVEARKPQWAKRGFQSDFALLGWGETEIPYSQRSYGADNR